MLVKKILFFKIGQIEKKSVFLCLIPQRITPKNSRPFEEKFTPKRDGVYHSDMNIDLHNYVWPSTVDFSVDILTSIICWQLTNIFDEKSAKIGLAKVDVIQNWLKILK